MIPKIPFGRTGHDSTRLLFGAAALGGMRHDKADATLATVREAGINHIDVAASYGEAELRLAPFLQDYRGDYFLATKTGDRTYDGARASIERSLSRMGVSQLDLIQFHNLATDNDIETVFGEDGALKAAMAARDQGLVRFIGITGHGTRIAEMHLKSLSRFDFDSVLLPYNPTLMRDETYSEEFETLYARCAQDGIAMQTIKSIARRRWQEGDKSPRHSWYEPIRDEDALRRAVHWVLSREGVFLNTSSDASLLPAIVDAASDIRPITDEDVEADMLSQSAEPLFVRGERDNV